MTSASSDTSPQRAQSSLLAAHAVRRSAVRYRFRELISREAFLVAALLALGCERIEATRATLSAEDAGWSTRLGALRSRQADVAARFAQWQGEKPASTAKGSDAVKWQARLLRARASVDGSRQTLMDVDTRRAEIVREVEAALERDGRAGEELLAQESLQMAEYLADQEQALTAAENAVAELVGHRRSK
jgi:hypothetical protein